MDTESAFRRCVASEAGLTLRRHTDSSAEVRCGRISILGSRRIHGDRPKHSAARACRKRAEKKDLELRRAAASIHDARTNAGHGRQPAHVSREEGRKISMSGTAMFSKLRIPPIEGRSKNWRTHSGARIRLSTQPPQVYAA